MQEKQNNFIPPPSLPIRQLHLLCQCQRGNIINSPTTTQLLQTKIYFCKSNFLITGDDEENVTWATDVSEDAVRERMTELSLGVKALAVDDDIEKSEPEKLNILFTFAKKALDKGKK